VAQNSEKISSNISKELKFKVKKDESSVSAQYSSPDKNLKNSTTATNKTINKNYQFDELLGTLYLT
jgi:hypothetical protein